MSLEHFRRVPAVERRLRQSPLPQPQLPLARDEALTEERLQHPRHRLSLAVIAVVVLQDVLDEIGMIEEKDSVRTERDDVSVVANASGEKSQRIPEEQLRRSDAVLYRLGSKR